MAAARERHTPHRRPSRGAEGKAERQTPSTHTQAPLHLPAAPASTSKPPGSERPQQATFPKRASQMQGGALSPPESTPGSSGAWQHGPRRKARIPGASALSRIFPGLRQSWESPRPAASSRAKGNGGPETEGTPQAHTEINPEQSQGRKPDVLTLSPRRPP